MPLIEWRVTIGKSASQVSDTAFGALADRIGVWVCLVGYLGMVQVASTPSVTGDLVLRLLWSASFVVGLLALCEIFRCPGWHRWSWQALGLVVGLAAGSTWYVFSQHTWAAWLSLVVMYVSLAWLDRTVVAALVRNRVGRWGARLILAGAGGFLPIILSQIESRFSDEEFFVFVQGVALAVFCLLFLSGQSYLDHRRAKTENSIDRPTRAASLVIIGGLTSMMIGLGVWGLVAYQHSFYTSEAPAYPGITETTPFVCGQVAPDSSRPSGVDVYRRLLARVEASPYRRAPEFAMLALGTGERRWAESFREAILAEARAGQFTRPANSVKSGQYDAALRVYYAPRVRAAFPDLFTEEDWSILRAWFAAINRRALTVEWVDWMYALAFSKWPEGPYENQENGAGLLAILEVEGLSPPELSPINQAYLERNRRGWVQRFHNTDDAFVYQPEWINNAYFQSLYWQAKTGLAPNSINQRLSFEWMLLQALPDGNPLRYNHPSLPSMAGSAYLGARLNSDPRLLWWSARALGPNVRESYLNAQPGAEEAFPAEGVPPTEGSCLLYSDSGLPSQKGPLAPDKIVFRDGWSSDSMYLLLNLRFSGWHRYKASNTVSLFYKQGPIVSEQTIGRSFWWLPTGRSQFRDKRVPRENLNGFLVERTGLGAVLYMLTGMGSIWAQDPPHYAQVESFETLGPLDVSRTVLPDWQGWTHARTVYFIHKGPVIVIDSAKGVGHSAIAWHLGAGRRDEGGLWLGDGSAPVRVLWPPAAWQSMTIQPAGTTAIGAAEIATWDVMYDAHASGQLDLVTTFLQGAWTGDDVRAVAGGQLVSLRDDGKRLMLLQNDTGRWLQTQDLATDGQWVLTVSQQANRLICSSGGTQVQVSLNSKPAALRDLAGNTWPNWEWNEGQLTLYLVAPDASVCLNVVK